jgi:hypothetical protein
MEHALQPRSDDQAYPLGESDMEWQLELFQVPDRKVSGPSAGHRASA